MTNSPSTSPMFARQHIETVNKSKVNVIYDYAFGVYLANNNFYKELNRIIGDITTKGKTRTINGTELDVSTYSGQAGLSIYQDQLTQARDTMNGLSELGMNNEKKLWQFN